jgi:Sel1 repeat
MRRCRLVLLFLLLVPSVAAAQGSTADGVRALIDRNYSTAFRILQPLSEADSRPDPIAQFFMATMYASGRGVARDYFHACGLYRRAGESASPLRIQSRAVASVMDHDEAVTRSACQEASAGRRAGVAGSSVTAFTDRRSPVASAADAFVRADFSRGVEILNPLIQQWPIVNDDAADFFMGMMYENGLGVPQDAVRACALYLRATIRVSQGTDSSSRGFPVDDLLRHLHSTLSPEQLGRCQTLAQAGFDHHFQKATFVLSQGSWVTLDLSDESNTVEAIVAHDSKARTVQLPGLLEPGVRFLPVEHTKLASGRPGSPSRHFLEFFRWVPVRRHLWSLRWSVFEVGRRNLMDVTSQELLSLSGEQPPDAATVDLHRLAHLAVNGDGDVEWEIAGARPQTEVIETEAEREQAAR